MQSLKDGSLLKAKQVEEHLGKHLHSGKNFLDEFRKFATRGNVVDLAIGVIIGAAFGKIVSSLVADVIMPAIGLIAGKVDLKSLYVALDHKTYESLEAAKLAKAPILTYGNFLQSVVDFLIVAFVIFVVVRQINKFTKPAPAPVTTRECPQCLSVIPIAAKRCAHCAQPVEATTVV
jgi:large conductance mechanosensitive channel